MGTPNSLPGRYFGHWEFDLTSRVTSSMQEPDSYPASESFGGACEEARTIASYSKAWLTLRFAIPLHCDDTHFLAGRGVVGFLYTYTY